MTLPSKPIIFVTYKAWIPKESLTSSAISDIKKRYTIRRYDEPTCRTCSNLSQRHNDICDECPRNAFIDTVVLYKDRVIKNQSYIGLPVGDKKYYKNFGISMSDYAIIDKRINAPFKYGIKFTGQLYDYQIPVVEQYTKAGYGMMQCPPRTGKGPMSVYLSVQYGQRTLFIAKQIEFLKQIEGHLRKMTNIEYIERRTGKKLCGFAKTEKDYDTMLFCLSTYQKFISDNGKNLLSRIKANFGMVIIDEAHGAAAICFAEVIASLYPRYLLGMTATPNRKDMRHVITEKIIGPVTAVSKRESLPVIMSVFETPVKFVKNYKLFIYSMRFLSKHEKRNDYILSHVIHDLKANPKVSIVMPLTFKDHIFAMVKAINEDMGCQVAEAFIGGGGKKNQLEREEILNRARSGKTRVVVGIRSLLQLGVDCPAWNLLYEVMPISNRPNLYQETSRIRTPDANQDNKAPRIKFFVDVEIKESLGCFRSTLGHLKFPEFSDYHWTDVSRDRLKSIMGGSGKFYGKDIDISTKEGYQRVQHASRPSGASLFDIKSQAGVTDSDLRKRRL